MRTKLVADLFLYKYLRILHQCFQALSNEDMSAYAFGVLFKYIYLNYVASYCHQSQDGRVV